MTDIILKLLTIFILLAAMALEVYLIISWILQDTMRRPYWGAYEDEEAPVPVNYVGEAKRAYNPSPEELEEVAKCVDSPNATAMDEGPTDIEKAIASTGDSDQLRLTLVELMRSGMTIRDASGRIVTEEQLLSKPGKKETEIPQDGGSTIRKAIEKLDIEFHNNVGRI